MYTHRELIKKELRYSGKSYENSNGALYTIKDYNSGGGPMAHMPRKAVCITEALQGSPSWTYNLNVNIKKDKEKLRKCSIKGN